MIFFRIICLLQMIATIFLAFVSLIDLFQLGQFYYFLQTIFFLLMGSLAIFGLNLLNTNYPDKPVTGKQKTAFNWLFLLNFLLLTFIFGLVFSEFRAMKEFSSVSRIPMHTFPFKAWIPLLIRGSILIFQLIILFNLYSLRRELYINYYTKQQFEFEKND